MTGFGKGEATVDDKKIRVELRSLNSKQLDLSIKLPGRYRAAEAEMRSIITRELQRGKVDCFVSFEAAVAETSAHINREAFKAYARQYPDNCTLLVDTYNVLKSGIPNAIRVFNEEVLPRGFRPKGIRIDSGDITYLSKKGLNQHEKT